MTAFSRVTALFALTSVLVGIVATQAASADEPHDGLELALGVRGVAGCNTRASDVTCRLPTGQSFTLEVSLDTLPDDIPSYGGFDLYVEFAGVTPTEGSVNNDDWPDCGFPAQFIGDGFVGWGCAINVPPAGRSSYIGPIGAVDFTCSQSGSLSLVHKAGEKTDLIEQVLPENEEGESEPLIHSEGAEESETITIECGQVPANTPGVVTGGTPGPDGPTPGAVRTPPGGVTTPGDDGPTLEPTAAAVATLAAADRATATAEAGGETGGENGEDDDDDDGSNAWVWIVIVVAGVAAVGIAGGGYWWFRNQQARSSGTPSAGGGDTPA